MKLKKRKLDKFKNRDFINLPKNKMLKKNKKNEMN